MTFQQLRQLVCEAFGFVEDVPFGDEWPEASYKVYVFQAVGGGGFVPRVIFHTADSSRPVMDADGTFSSHDKAWEAANIAIMHDRSPRAESSE